MNSALVWSFAELLQFFPPGSLIAVCGRSGSCLDNFLGKLVLSVGDENPERVLMLAGRCRTTSISCVGGRCLHDNALTGAPVATRYRPSWARTGVLRGGLQTNFSSGGMLVDAVPIELRSLSRNFDCTRYLTQMKRWAQGRGRLALVRSNLLRRLEHRGDDFRPCWRDMPSSLRREANGAVMLYHPATYFADVWTQEWHEIVCMVFVGSRILRLNAEAPIRTRNHWALNWRTR